MAQNPFDKYDAPAAGGNPFDKYDEGAEDKGGTLSDLGKSLKVGFQELPGMATGLADLPFALANGSRPFTKAADAVGEATGFQPGKWAKETKFSAGYERGKANIDKAWEDGSAGDIALEYLKNPGYTAQQVAQSVPGMLAGGVGSKLALGAGRVAAVAGEAAAGIAAKKAVPGALERVVGKKWAVPVAAGAGEGAVTTGQQMDQYEGEDQQKNALAALAAGAGTAAIGVGAGRLANKLGLETAETAIAKAGSGAAGAADAVPLSARKRILGGIVSEAVLQEMPQSAQEQMWQNYADGKPVMEGVTRATVEGGLAGGVMGGVANVRGPSAERGPAPEVEGGDVPPVVTAEPLALPAPTIDVAPDGTARTAADRNARLTGIADGDITDVTPIERRPSEVMGLDPNAGSLSAAAVVAVDSGASGALEMAVSQEQSAHERENSVINIDEISDPYERAYYESFFNDANDVQANPQFDAWLQADDNIPDFDAAGNATDEDFLRAMGATDEEIADAVTHQPQRAQEGDPSAAGAAPDDAGSSLESAGQPAPGPQAGQGQVNADATDAVAPGLSDLGGPIGDVAGRGDRATDAVPGAQARRADADTRAPQASNGEPGAAPDGQRADGDAALATPTGNERGAAITSLKDGLAAIRARKEQEKAGAASQPKEAPELDQQAQAATNSIAQVSQPQGAPSGPQAEQAAAQQAQAGSTPAATEGLSAAPEGVQAAPTASVQPEFTSGSEPRSAVAGQQPPYAGSPDDVSGQDAPIARGENSSGDGSDSTPAVTGQRPAFETAAGDAPESESSQGSSNARGQDSSVAQTTNPAQPVTRADVAAAEQQAIAAIAQRIDAMKAGEVNSRAAKFLPTMGMKAVASKERNKAMLTDANRVNLLAAAGEFGVELAPSVRQALEKNLEGKVEPDSAPEPAAKGNTPIADVGEKIGGARKDTATSTNSKPRTAAKDDDRPTWAKRYEVSQVAGGFDMAVNGRDITGKWLISDTRSKDAYGQPRHMGRKYFDTKEEAEAALPLLAVAQKHRVTSAYGRDADGNTVYEIWRDISERKRVKVVDKQFPTRDAAMEYMAKHPAEILETSTTFGEADIPKPDSTERKGAPRRTGDVKGEDFMAEFGLRGVEFGNWNNQEERQEVMNAAYDGLMDLAEVLKVPPKALGLNGDLALAFGARGKGLSGARAHYEPARVVMNLTKMNGAGALAHEWFHALDHYLARQDGKATADWKVNKDGTRSLDVAGGGGDMASSGFRRANSGVREELRKAYASLVQSLFSKAEQYVEDTAKADKFVAVSRGELEQQLAKLRTDLSAQLPAYVKRNNKPASAEQLAAFDAIAAELVEGRGLETEWKTLPGKTVRDMQVRHTNDSLERLSEIYKAVRGRSGFNSEKTGALNSLTQYMRRYEQRLNMLRDASAETTKTKSVPTSFAMDAKSLDQGRGGEYWTTPHEMVARAFQGFVEDKIAERGGKSPFLNYAPENSGILTPWGAKRPFPAGEERKAMNGEFDKFVDALQTKETEKGVALFSAGSTPPAKPLSLDRVNELVQEALGGIRGAPPVEAVGSPADIGLVVPPSTVPYGITLGSGDVYVFQSAMGSDLDVFRTVFHELFHRGVRVLVPRGRYVQTMLDLAKGDSRIQQYAVRWKNSDMAIAQKENLRKMGYTGTDLTSQFEALSIEEALADVAEELKADRKTGTKPKSMTIRYLAGWLAKVADLAGMKKLAQAIRVMTYNEAERFVMQAIDRSGEPVNVPGEATARSAEGADVPKFRSANVAGVAARMGEAIKSVTVQNIKDQASYKKSDWLGLGLQALGRRQIVDIYGKDLSQLSSYNKLAAQMEADKNEVGAEADQLARRWGKLKDEKALAELMHDATLAQIDPDKPYEDGDDKAQFTVLSKRFKALTEEAKQVYRDARAGYEDHHTKVREAIKQRIMRSELAGPRRAELLKRMDDEFFKKTKGVYFPLARFGQYVVAVKGPDGKIASVNRAETMAEAQALRASLVKAFPPSSGNEVIRPTLSKEFIASRDAVGRGFMTELYGALDGVDMSAVERAELEDTLGQLYLSSLPDLSWAKHGIHRKGTPGFSQDARRAFAQNMFHGGRYLAKLRYGDLLQTEITDMQKTVDDWQEVEDFDQPTAQRVVDEMQKRHESLMNPKSNPLSSSLTSFGFVFFLGLSPASALVNLSQTALVAYPVMAAKWGFDKSGAALLRASKEAAKGKNDITGSLTPEERAAYDEAVRAGTIDVTMAHDLAGIAQGEDSGVMWKIRPVMRWASFMFHHAERFNRQVTFIAAYRLAKDAGADAKTAFEQATEATYQGHFDYSAGNRPRVMQGNTAKVLLLFKQYGQNMIYTLARSAQQSIKGETPEARREARRALTGLLVMHGLGAGTLGLPLVTTLLAAASMIGGGDDEPWDAKVALQNMLADAFGQKPAEVMMHGLSRLTPWDVSGRIGLDRLILPDVQEGLEGQRLAESAMTAALGPVAGIGVNILKGVQDMGKGQFGRGLEGMLPAAVRNGIKGIRYANEGALDKSGIVIKDEVSPAEYIGQMLGFSPSQVRNASEGKSAVLDLDRALGRRRSHLLTEFANARRDGDAAAVKEAHADIAKFNEKNPGRRITVPQMMASVRARQRRIDQAKDGLYLPKSRTDARDVGRFALEQ